MSLKQLPLLAYFNISLQCWLHNSIPSKIPLQDMFKEKTSEQPYVNRHKCQISKVY